MTDQLRVALWTAVVRGFRVTVGLVAGVLVAHFSDQQIWLVIGPVVNGAGKFLREKYGWDWLPV